MTNVAGGKGKKLRLLARLVALLGAGVLVVGCHVGSSTTTTSSSTSSTTTTQASTTTSTSSTTTTLALQSCSTGVLTASASSGGIAAGTGYETFSVINGGPSRCFVTGYANLAFFGPSAAGGAGTGPHLSVTVNETGVTGAQVTLSTHESGSFSMRYSNEPVGGLGCVTVASAELSLPGAPETLSFPMSLTLCGGTVQIGPFGSPGPQTS